jgi:hypothetical protein
MRVGKVERWHESKKIFEIMEEGMPTHHRP